MAERLLKVPEAAAALAVSPKTIWAWRAQRRIAVVTIGAAVRISQGEIDRLIAEGTVPARELP